MNHGFDFISNVVRYALSLCKWPEELSDNPGFRCAQMARADVVSIEIAHTGYYGGYQLSGLVNAAQGPRLTLPFAAHYWMFS